MGAVRRARGETRAARRTLRRAACTGWRSSGRSTTTRACRSTPAWTSSPRCRPPPGPRALRRARPARRAPPRAPRAAAAAAARAQRLPCRPRAGACCRVSWVLYVPLPGVCATFLIQLSWTPVLTSEVLGTLASALPARGCVVRVRAASVGEAATAGDVSNHANSEAPASADAKPSTKICTEAWSCPCMHSARPARGRHAAGLGLASTWPRTAGHAAG